MTTISDLTPNFLVHVLGKDRATLADDQGLFLDRTWRLHPAICAFTSELYYERRLRSVDALERRALPLQGNRGGGRPIYVCFSDGAVRTGCPARSRIPDALAAAPRGILLKKGIDTTFFSFGADEGRRARGQF